jgi:hypothetical protein
MPQSIDRLIKYPEKYQMSAEEMFAGQISKTHSSVCHNT